MEAEKPTGTPDGADLRPLPHRQAAWMILGFVLAVAAPGSDTVGPGIAAVIATAVFTWALFSFSRAASKTGAPAGLFRAAAILSLIYTLALAAMPAYEDKEGVLLAMRVATGAGVIGMLLLAGAFRRFFAARNGRLSRWWSATQWSVAIVYVLPLAIGCLYPLYGVYLKESHLFAVVYSAARSFNLHGLHMMQSPRQDWLYVVRGLLISPAAAMAIGLLWTFLTCRGGEARPAAARPDDAVAEDLPE